MPELSKEERTELQETVNAGAKLRDLLRHPGWKDVLRPRFDKMREAMIDQFLTSPLDLAGFQLIQQSVNALDNIIGGIDFAIEKGESAELSLKAKEEEFTSK